MIPFSKMHGAGNDFVLVEPEAILEHLLPEASRRLCDRKLGVGADGLLVAASSEIADVRFRMFNPDGSEAEMCGNGLRCFARRLVDLGRLSESAQIETGSGVKEVSVLEGGMVRVDMGPPRVASVSEDGSAIASWGLALDGVDREFEGYAVCMGNPHLVIFEPISAADLASYGPILECHPRFPNRVNVHFVEVVARDHVNQHTWERGAGITYACGTGACAVVVAGVLSGRLDRECRVTLPGGELRIEWPDDGSVWKTGPTAYVFEGEFPAPL